MDFLKRIKSFFTGGGSRSSSGSSGGGGGWGDDSAAREAERKRREEEERKRKAAEAAKARAAQEQAKAEAIRQQRVNEASRADGLRQANNLNKQLAEQTALPRKPDNQLQKNASQLKRGVGVLSPQAMQEQVDKQNKQKNIESTMNKVITVNKARKTVAENQNSKDPAIRKAVKTAQAGLNRGGLKQSDVEHIGRQADTINQRKSDMKTAQDALDTQVYGRKNPKKVVKLGDRSIGGSLGDMTPNQLIDRYKKSSATEQMILRRGLEKELDALGRDYSDGGATSRAQIETALSLMSQNDKRTVGSTLAEIGVGVADFLPNAYQGVAEAIDTAIGSREKISDTIMESADFYYAMAQRAQQSGDRRSSILFTQMADEKAREAQRALGAQVEAAGKAPGQVVQGVTAPASFLAGGGAVVRPIAAGIRGAASGAASQSIASMAASGLANRGVNQTAARIAGEFAEANIFGSIDTVANQYAELGPDVTASGLGEALAMDTAFTAGLPVAGHLVGRGARGIRNRIGGRSIEAIEKPDTLGSPVQPANPADVELPPKMEISQGITSKNASDAARRQQEQLRQRQQAEIEAARQQQAQDLLRMEGDTVRHHELEQSIYGDQRGESNIDILEENPLDQSGTAPFTVSEYRDLAEHHRSQAEAPAPPVRPVEPRPVDPEIEAQQQAAIEDASQRNRQVTQQIEEPTPVAQAPVKTEGRVKSEKVAAQTPPKAPKPTKPAKAASESAGGVSTLQANLGRVEGDIAAIKAQGREVPKALLDLQRQLRNELADEREMARVTRSESATPAPKPKIDTTKAPTKPKKPKTVEPTATKREINSAMVDSLFEKGGTLSEAQAKAKVIANKKAKQAKTTEVDVSEGGGGTGEPRAVNQTIPMPTKVYRGVDPDTNQGIGNARLGQGLYTTTNKKTAKQYGKVSEYGAESLPTKPLQFTDDIEMAEWVARVSDETGIPVKELYGDGNKFNEVVTARGYDGLTVGTGKNMEIVKYTPSEPTVQKAKAAPAKKAEAPFKPTPAKSVLSDAPKKPAQTVEQKAAAIAEQKKAETKAADAAPSKAKAKNLEAKIERAEASLSRAEEKLKDLRIANNSPNQIKQAETVVKRAQTRLNNLREFGATEKSHQPTPQQQAAKPSKAILEARKLKKAESRKKAKAEGVELKKGRPGGNITTFMARNTREVTNNATLERDLASSVDGKKASVSFKTDYPKALTEQSKKTTGELKSSSSTLAKGDSFTYQNKLDAIAMSSATDYQLSSLIEQRAAIKGKSEKANSDRLALDKQINEIHEIKGDLMEFAAKADEQHGRALGLSSWLFRTLDPGIVSSRIMKRADKLNDELAIVDSKTGKKPDLSYTPEERVTITKLTQGLKKAFDADDAVSVRYEKSLSVLESKNSTPNERLAAVTRLTKDKKAYEKTQRELKKAYDSVNSFTEGRELKLVQEGKLRQPVTYGVGLNKYQKLNMLSGPAGRIKDLQSTAIHLTDVTIADMVRAAGGKVANRLQDTDQYHSTARWSKGARRRGFIEGWRKTKDTFAGRQDSGMGLSRSSGGYNRGHSVTDRLHEPEYEPGTLQAGASRLRKVANKGANIIRGGVAAPTHLFGEPYTAMKLDVLYRDKGRKLGLKGRELEVYVAAKSAKPDESILKKVNYSADEISGLHSKWSKDLDRVHRKLLNKQVSIGDGNSRSAWGGTWDGDKTKPGWREARLRAQVTGYGTTVTKNIVVPFTSWPFSATKSMLTTQNPAFHGLKALRSGILKGSKSATPEMKAKYAQDFVDDLSNAAYSSAKASIAFAALSPFLSSEDADGNSYNPPYIKIPLGNGEYYTNDLSALGVLAAPLISAWSAKEAIADIKERGVNPGIAFVSLPGRYIQGLASKTGLDDTIDTRSVPLVEFISRATRSYAGSDNTVGQALSDATMETLTDIATQSVLLSGLSRDAQALVSSTMRLFGASDEAMLAPDNKSVDRETGKENVAMTGLKTVAGVAIPGLSEAYERNEDGRERPGFFGKMTGGDKTNADKAEENRREEGRVKEATSSLKDTGLFGDKGKDSKSDKKTSTPDKKTNTLDKKSKLYDSLSDDSKKLLERADINKRDLSSHELRKIRNELAQDKVAEKMLNQGDIKSYRDSRQMKLDALRNPQGGKEKDKTAIQKVKREIKRADLAIKDKVDPEIYRKYAVAGASEEGKIGKSDMTDMLNPDNWDRDLETAQKLIELDQKMSEQGLSTGTRGEEPWSKPVFDERMVRRVGQASLAKESGIDGEVFKLYTGIGTSQGGSISQSELNKMMDSDKAEYNPELAAKLLEIDELMTEQGLSENTSGVNPWLRRKYKEPSDGKGKGGGGGGGSPKKLTVAGFSGAKRITPEGPALKYRAINRSESPIPNLAAQTAQTGLKKRNITVKKGVHL